MHQRLQSVLHDMLGELQEWIEVIYWHLLMTFMEAGFYHAAKKKALSILNTHLPKMADIAQDATWIAIGAMTCLRDKQGLQRLQSIFEKLSECKPDQWAGICWQVKAFVCAAMIQLRDFTTATRIVEELEESIDILLSYASADKIWRFAEMGRRTPIAYIHQLHVMQCFLGIALGDEKIWQRGALSLSRMHPELLGGLEALRLLYERGGKSQVAHEGGEHCHLCKFIKTTVDLIRKAREIKDESAQVALAKRKEIEKYRSLWEAQQGEIWRNISWGVDWMILGASQLMPDIILPLCSNGKPVEAIIPFPLQVLAAGLMFVREMMSKILRMIIRLQ